MAKRKNFSQIRRHNFSYTNSRSHSVLNGCDVVSMASPRDSVIVLPLDYRARRTVDFTSLYGCGIDFLTGACQQIIQNLLEENKLTIPSVLSYYDAGFRYFLRFCKGIASELDRPFLQRDVNRHLLELFIQDLTASQLSHSSKTRIYKRTEYILLQMVASEWLESDGLFPESPFINKKENRCKGKKALSILERNRLIQLIKTDLANIKKSDRPLNSNELVTCMLAIAIRTGINPTPLIELTTDCLKLHPFLDNRRLLVSFKRRGKGTQTHILRGENKQENSHIILMDVVEIIELVKARNEVLREGSDFNEMLFVYISNKSRGRTSAGDVVPFSRTTLSARVDAWVKRHKLLDDNGQYLKLSIMRLRKTFINRIYQLSGQDPLVTAKAGNHTPQVSMSNYLQAPPEAEKEFSLLGEVLTSELLGHENSGVLSAEYTPVSRCKDPLNGQFSPASNDEYCSNFLACVRCRSFVVTEEDLYRLFSFYWMLVYEREYIGAHKWARYYRHIIRLIDKDIVPLFDSEVVEREKTKAKESPHPYWMTRDQLEGLI